MEPIEHTHAHTHSHSRVQGHAHAHHHDTVGNIKVAFFLNLAFTILEIVGGLWTNSLAILSDAVHDFGDSLSLGLAWYLERYSEREGDHRYSYGYRRFSLLGALVNTVILLVGSLFLLSEAIPRLIHPEHSNAPGMALIAVVGILVNGLAVLRLRGDRTFNARVVAWHLLEDVLGWVAVLVVSVTLLFVDIHLLDPLLSILISVYVLYNVVGNLRKTLALFLQAVPEGVDLREIDGRLMAIDSVRSTHHTHVWSIDGQHHVLTTHVVVDPEISREEIMCIKGEIDTLGRELDLLHTTVEIEYEGEQCRVVLL